MRFVSILYLLLVTGIVLGSGIQATFAEDCPKAGTAKSATDPTLVTQEEQTACEEKVAADKKAADEAAAKNVAEMSSDDLKKAIADCVARGEKTDDNKNGCSGTTLTAYRDLLKEKQSEKPEVDCTDIKNAGVGYCKSAKGYAAASGTVTQLTSAYSQAAEARALQSLGSQYSGGMNTAQLEQEGLHAAGIESQQAANRQKFVAGIGLSIAASNFAAAKYSKDGASKAANNQAGLAALSAAMTPAMLAMQDQQAANQLRAQEEAHAKWMASQKGTNTIIQSPNSPNLPPIDTPTAPTNPSNSNYDTSMMGGTIGNTPNGNLDPASGDLAWNGSGSGGGGGGGGFPGGGGGGGMHGMGGGGSGSPMPYMPPMDPNAGRPTMANVDESGAGYKAGRGDPNNPNKLDMNSMLAQFLPKEGDKIGNVNGVVKNDTNSRAIASESISLLDANVNIFNRISDIYSQKAKDGLIQL